MFQACVYTHSDSVIVYICIESHYLYSCSLSFNLQHVISTYRLSLKANDAGESTEINDEQDRYAMQQESTDITMIATEREAVPYYMSHDIVQSKKGPAVFIWALLIGLLTGTGQKQCAKNVVELAHPKNFNLEAIRVGLNIVTLCNALMAESISRTPGSKGFVKEVFNVTKR